MNAQVLYLNQRLQKRLQEVQSQWKAINGTARLWQKDSSLWTGDGESNWLGWLEIPKIQLSRISELSRLKNEILAHKFSHILLLGMGGSSLCPEVLSKSFRHQPNHPELLVLDSVDPGQIKSFENKIDLAKTLFIVSSKSGSTLEPNCLMSYFLHRVGSIRVESEIGSQFMAITDPGSPLETKAKEIGFKWICYGVKDIGGRFSALSDFGLVPAMLMGINVEELLITTMPMVQACQRDAIEHNPGVELGLVLGTAYLEGIDKLTIICSPPIEGLGAWLEQLIAESTGKHGKGIFPIDREPLCAPEYYGQDRLFIYLRYAPAPDQTQDDQIKAIIEAGLPVVFIELRGPYHLGQEFFRWEIATAVAGAIMNLNPFDQPDVEASKIAARRITSQFEQQGILALPEPDFQTDQFKIYLPAHLKEILIPYFAQGLNPGLQKILDLVEPKDFLAILAFLEMNNETAEKLQKLRHAVIKKKKVATSVGFGPRYLHSTGQAFKGGPNLGVYLQITRQPQEDLPVPGKNYTFGLIELAQAQGDFQVMCERSRRIIRIHIEGDVLPALDQLLHALEGP